MSAAPVLAGTAIERTCLTCDAVYTKSRPPRGWRVDGKRVWCPACVNKLFIRRAIAFVVAKPINMEWDAFNTVLRDAWNQSTALSNWAVLKLLQGDVIRKPADEKLPAMPKVELYKLWGEEYDARTMWTGAAQNAQALLREVELRYRKARYDTLWKRAAAPPTYRYPKPYPSHQQSWGVFIDTSNDITYTTTLPGGRVQLKLRRGDNFRRQVGALEKLLDGSALQCESAIYRARIGGDSGQTADQGRVRYRVMVKLAMWLPRDVAMQSKDEQQVRAMTLRTDKDAFLIADPVPDRAAWRLNLDQLRRVVRAHEVYRRRMAEDLKFEKRYPKRTRDRMNEALDRRCDKQHNRLKSAMQQTAAQIAGLARRTKTSIVLYDDTMDTYVSPFPWAQFRTLLETKLDEVGVNFRHVGRKAATEESEEATLDAPTADDDGASA